MEKIEPELIESFIDLNQFLQRHAIRYCLIGGLAAGYWGEPRYTKDIDFTVVSHTRRLDEIAGLLKGEGYKIRNKGESQLQVVQKGDRHFLADLILADTDYQDWVVQRAVSVPMFSIHVPICSPEDLVILKIIANRRQDLLDIENVLKNHSKNLDKNYLQKWFAFWEVEDRFKKEFPSAL